MRLRFQPWQLAVLLVMICAALAGWLVWRARTIDHTAADLAAYLPAGEALVFYVDVDALRKAGLLELLAGSKVAEENEYTIFVQQSGFNYRDDLDSALIARRQGTVFLLLRGRFDWPSLNRYVAMQGGACHNGFCRVSGSDPSRKISFFPLRPHLMAMAVGPDRSAALELRRRKRHADPEPVPIQPVWLQAPSSSFKDVSGLPAGTHLFAKALEGADRVRLALGADGERFQLTMDAACRTSGDAALLHAQFEKITDVLRKMISRTSGTNPRDLSGVLTGGRFRREDRRVLGSWPVERVFVEAVAGSAP